MEYASVYSFYLIGAAAFLLYAVLELATGRFRLRGISATNSWVDTMSIAIYWGITGPAIAFGSAWIETRLLPGAAGSLAHTPVLLQIVIILIAEDMVQYWWHRSSHTFPVLWRLHKPHHTAPYMGVRMVYRNGLFYGLLMPNLWFAGVLVYLGFGKVYLGYAIVKALVTIGAHSEIRWDSWLYRYRFLHPLAWLVERTISTPATHFAHHAATEEDGIGHYNGNYGNLLFFWDVLFGTARITRRYPPAFGIEQPAGHGDESWWMQLFYPVLRPRQNANAEKTYSSQVLEAGDHGR